MLRRRTSDGADFAAAGEGDDEGEYEEGELVLLPRGRSGGREGVLVPGVPEAEGARRIIACRERVSTRDRVFRQKRPHLIVVLSRSHFVLEPFALGSVPADVAAEDLGDAQETTALGVALVARGRVGEELASLRRAPRGQLGIVQRERMWQRTSSK